MAHPDPGLAHHRRLQRPHRGPQLHHQKGQARIGRDFGSSPTTGSEYSSPSGAATGPSSTPHPAETRRTGYLDADHDRAADYPRASGTRSRFHIATEVALQGPSRLSGYRTVPSQSLVLLTRLWHR
jgi:hypothetical protein